MSHIGEFDLIRRIAATSTVPSGTVGIGDDCAVIPQTSGLDTLVTTDLLIEGLHFLLEDITPFELGWKSAAVNISDIAGMGGRPTSAFLSIALPDFAKRGEVGLPGRFRHDGEGGSVCRSGRGGESPDSLQVWMDEFIQGFNALCGRFGVRLLGGDTSASDDKLFINVTLLGECPHGQAVLRSGARPGDIIYVSGPLGDSAAGLRLILERRAGEAAADCAGRPLALGRPGDPFAFGRPGDSPESILIRRHYLPEPRVALGQALAALPSVHAMMDISDGIASDLRHILEASGGAPATILAAEVDVRSIPLSEALRSVCEQRGWDAAELAVSGGEDYELLFTAAPGTEVPEGCVAIGRIVQLPAAEGGQEAKAAAIRWIGSDRDYKGFTHF